MILDIGVAIAPEGFDRARMNAFEQQDLDFSLVEGSFFLEASHLSPSYVGDDTSSRYRPAEGATDFDRRCAGLR